jgi:hypothetical protein
MTLKDYRPEDHVRPVIRKKYVPDETHTILRMTSALNERKQNRENLISALNKGFYFMCVVRLIHRYQVKYNDTFFSLFCLPVGKADDTPSAVLERVRGSLLQLHPFRLASGASSTFAQLGFNHIFEMFDCN